MAQEVKKTMLDVVKEKYDAALKSANEALGKKPVDHEGYNNAIIALDAAEKEFTTVVANAMYDEYAKKENPVVEIIKAYGYKTLGHKVVYDKDDKSRITEVNAIEKDRQIDLFAFCKRAKIDTDWQYIVSKFNKLMCLRAAVELGLNTSDIKKITSSYYIQEKAKEIEMGKTPTSNTQVCKLLQRVIDEILPNEDAEGKTIYKVNNHDVAYLDDLYGRKSNKAILTVRVSNDAFLRRVLVDIAYRLVTNGKYGVDGYKVAKEK